MKIKRGQSLFEVSVALFLIVPVLLLVCDLAMIVIGVQANDSTCRDAARLAASGDPNTAKLRALAVIARANHNMNGFVSNFSLAKLDSTVTAAQLASLNPYGGTITGAVTVSTEVEVRPFLVHWLYSGKQPMTFHSRQSYPFTYVIPNTSQALP
jgi:hypothetical protein